MGSRRVIPADCVFLPVSGGAVAVSREHAVFCGVAAAEAGQMRKALADGNCDDLSESLVRKLDEHGFFGGPQPAAPDPPSVQLQLTNDCNLACSYCCTNSGAPRRSEVTHAQMREVVRQIPSAMGARTSVALLGGEPLRVPWALELAGEILDLGLRLTIFTNGTPLDDDGVAAGVAGLVGRGAQVRVSLGGGTKCGCDALSGAPRFDAAMSGVARLAAHGARAFVDIMVTPSNADELASCLPELRRRLPEGVKIALGVLYHSGRETGMNLFGSRAELDAALDRIAFEAGETIPAAQPKPTTNRREACTCALGRHVHVRSDGALFNCFKMEEKLGDLAAGFREGARRIMESPRRAADSSRCTDCPLVSLCGGGCRSENLLYTGDPECPPCGPWRVRALSEMLASDRPDVVEWPLSFLIAEAHSRGLDVPEDVKPRVLSRHLSDV